MDFLELLDIFKSVRALAWTAAGVVVGFALYWYLEPGPLAAWIAVPAGFFVTIAGQAWQARRDKD